MVGDRTIGDGDGEAAIWIVCCVIVWLAHSAYWPIPWGEIGQSVWTALQNFVWTPLSDHRNQLPISDSTNNPNCAIREHDYRDAYYSVTWYYSVNGLRHHLMLVGCAQSDLNQICRIASSLLIYSENSLDTIQWIAVQSRTTRKAFEGFRSE